MKQKTDITQNENTNTLNYLSVEVNPKSKSKSRGSARKSTYSKPHRRSLSVSKYISARVSSKIREHFAQNLVKKEVYNPRKLRIKEFEGFVEDSIRSINQMLRRSSFELKKVLQDVTSSTDFIIEKLQESITLSSLAGGWVL